MFVSPDSRLKFLAPVCLAGFTNTRQDRLKTSFAHFSRMPEVSINEDRNLLGWKDDVRLTKDARRMDTKAEAHRMKGTSKLHFGFVVARSYRRHVPIDFVGTFAAGHLLDRFGSQPNRNSGEGSDTLSLRTLSPVRARRTASPIA